MTEAQSTSEQDGNQTSGETSAAGDEFKPITSQDEFNRLLDDRLKRERAKYADYKDVKAKASKLDEIEQANKSEIDKAMDRVAKAEAEVAQIPTRVADALREHLISLHTIPKDDAELFLTATDPELLLKQVDRLIARTTEAASERKKTGNHVPREGGQVSTPGGDSDAQFARQLFSPT
jgi:hypothetical protein